jgi:hypothetical protein
VHDRYNAEIQSAMAGTVWLANCNNYYRHANGKVVTQFPYSGRVFAERISDVRLDDYYIDDDSRTTCAQSTTPQSSPRTWTRPCGSGATGSA